MARVPKSKNCHETIISNIRLMYKARHEEAAKFETYGTTENTIADMIYDAAVPQKHRYLINQLPSTFFTEGREVPIRFKVSDTENRSMRLSMSFSRTIPVNWQYRHGDAKFPVTAESAPEAHALLLKRYNNKQAIREAEEAFLSAFEDAWSEASSVNKLVEQWPHARDFLTDGYRHRLDHKEEKPSRRKGEIDPEKLNQLNAALFAAKVAR